MDLLFTARRRKRKPLVFTGVLLLALLPSYKPVLGQNPPPGVTTVPVVVNYKQVGQIMLQSVSGGLQGVFQPANGQTIADYEKQMGQDHLNWFQVVTSTPNPVKRPPGQPPLTVPYIDPPSGGNLKDWADNQPWYYDESSKPAGDHRRWNPAVLANQNTINASQKPAPPSQAPYFFYNDGPQGAPGTTESFDTFMISIFSDGTYQPMGGFSWTVTFDQNGNAVVTSVTPWPTFFPAPYADMIRKFGNSPQGQPWKIHPAKPSKVGSLPGNSTIFNPPLEVYTQDYDSLFPIITGEKP